MCYSPANLYHHSYFFCFSNRCKLICSIFRWNRFECSIMKVNGLEMLIFLLLTAYIPETSPSSSWMTWYPALYTPLTDNRPCLNVGGIYTFTTTGLISLAPVLSWTKCVLRHTCEVLIDVAPCAVLMGTTLCRICVQYYTCQKRGSFILAYQRVVAALHWPCYHERAVRPFQGNCELVTLCFISVCDGIINFGIISLLHAINNLKFIYCGVIDKATIN